VVASFNVVYRISVSVSPQLATVTGSATVTGNNGAVSYTQSTGTPQLTVSSTGLVVRI
jgi:hypothetical protein